MKSLENRLRRLEDRAVSLSKSPPQPEDIEERLQALDTQIDALPPEAWRPILDTTPPLHPWNGPTWLASYVAERHGWGPVGGAGWQFLWWERAALISLVCTPAHFAALPEDVQERLLARAREEVRRLKLELDYQNNTRRFDNHMKTASLSYLLTEEAQ